MSMFPLIFAGITGLAVGAAATLWLVSKAPSTRTPLGFVLGLLLIAQFVIAGTRGGSPQDVGMMVALSGYGAQDLVWGFAGKVFYSALLMGGLVVVTRSNWAERAFGMIATAVFALPFYVLNVTMVGVGSGAGAL